jgi:hypothetical protein
MVGYSQSAWVYRPNLADRQDRLLYGSVILMICFLKEFEYEPKTIALLRRDGIGWFWRCGGDNRYIKWRDNFAPAIADLERV